MFACRLHSWWLMVSGAMHSLRGLPQPALRSCPRQHATPLIPCTNARTMQAVYHLRQLSANQCTQAQVREQLLGMVLVETVKPPYPERPYRFTLPYVVTIRGEAQGILRSRAHTKQHWRVWIHFLVENSTKTTVKI